MRESSQSLEAFTLYRDMGSERSTAKVAQQCSKNKSLIDRWSGQHAWVERVRQHDEAIAAEAAERDKHARLTEADTLRRARFNIAQTEQVIVLKWLQCVAADPKAIAALKAGEVVALAKGAQDTQRIEHGEATDQTRTQVQWEMLSDDALLARARALGLAGTD